MLKKIFGAAVLACTMAACAAEMQIFPADFQKGNFAVNEGFLAPIRVSFIDDGYEWAKDEAKLIVETDAAVPVVAAASFRPNCAFAMPVSVEGGKCTVELPAAFMKNLVNPNGAWMNYLNLYFRAAKGAAGKRFPVTLTVAGKTKTFLVKKLNFTVAPELPQSIPMQELSTGHWYFHSSTLPKECDAIFEENLNFWKGLCAKPTTVITNLGFSMAPERLKAITDGFEHCYLLHSVLDTPTPVGTSYGFFDNNHEVSRPGVQKLVTRDGKGSRGAICPTYMRKDPEGIFWSKHMAEGLRRAVDAFPTISAIMIDYESHAYDALCEDCRKDFAAQEKLAKVPEAKELVPGAPLYTKWVVYRARTRNEIVKKLGEVIHKEFPNIKFRMCSSALVPGETYVESWSGLDVKGMEPFVDEFMNMHYCSGKNFFDMLELNRKEFKKPQRVLCDPAEDLFSYYNRYTPEKLRQNVIATYALGSKNLTLYPTDYYDAAYLTVLVRSFNAVAQAEKAYLKGALKTGLVAAPKNVTQVTLPDGDVQKTITFPDFSGNFRSYLHSDGESDFITLFNFSEDSSIFVELSIPGFKKSACNVTDLLTGSVYTGISADMVRKGFLVEIPKNGTILLKVGGEAVNREKELPQSAIQEALNRELKTVEANSKNFDTITSPNKNLSIGYVISKGKVALQMKIGNSFLKLSPEKSGNLVGWKIPAIGEMIEGSRGKCFGNLIVREELGKVPQEVPYMVTDRMIHENSYMVVTMEYTVPADNDAGGSGNPLSGLKIIRKVGMHNYWGSMTVSHTFVNTSDHDMTVAFRLFNMPFYRAKAKDGKETILSNDQPLELGVHSFILKGQPNTWSFMANPTEMDDLSVHYNVGFLRATATFEGFTGLYCWGDGIQQTVEPTSPEFVLKPGEEKTFTQKVNIVDTRKN